MILLMNEKVRDRMIPSWLCLAVLATLSVRADDIVVVSNPLLDGALTGPDIGTPSSAPPAPAGGGGVQVGIYPEWYEYFTEPIYDVLVRTTERQYLPGETVKAHITIFNRGDVPDKDTVLEYFFISPNGSAYGAAREQFLEIAPGKEELDREYILPPDAEVGEWRVSVLYTTEYQPKIAVYASFDVVTHKTRQSIGIISAGIMAVAVIALIFKKRRGGQNQEP